VGGGGYLPLLREADVHPHFVATEALVVGHHTDAAPQRLQAGHHRGALGIDARLGEGRLERHAGGVGAAAHLNVHQLRRRNPRPAAALGILRVQHGGRVHIAHAHVGDRHRVPLIRGLGDQLATTSSLGRLACGLQEAGKTLRIVLVWHSLNLLVVLRLVNRAVGRLGDCE
jgi:hypothetical protein